MSESKEKKENQEIIITVKGGGSITIDADVHPGVVKHLKTVARLGRQANIVACENELLPVVRMLAGASKSQAIFKKIRARKDGRETIPFEYITMYDAMVDDVRFMVKEVHAKYAKMWKKIQKMKRKEAKAKEKETTAKKEALAKQPQVNAETIDTL